MERKLSASVDDVFARLTDPAWLEARSKALGELSAKVTVKKAAKKLTLTMKRRVRRELPALLASVMPSESDILFTETWASDGAGGWDGELDMQIPGQPVSLSAEFTLAASGKGCVYAIEHEARCSLPFIGSAVAAVARQLVEQGCEDELDHLERSLKGAGEPRPTRGVSASPLVTS